MGGPDRFGAENMRLSAVRPVALLLCRELAFTALLLVGVSVVVFLILHLAPGDPFSALLGNQMVSASVHGEMQQAMGDQGTWYGRYLAWLAKMVRGDFGTSIRTGLPVLGEVVRVGINTLYLTLGSMLVTLLIAVPIALSSSRHGTTLRNWPFTMFAYVISALPVFWLSYVVIYFFLHKFRLFPIIVGPSGHQKWISFLLPVLVLGIANGTVSEVVRHLQNEMSRVLAEDYIRTARAKGASVWAHAFKEGFLIPVTEMIAAKMPFILGGAVVVEQVFNWPGMGRMAWQAAQDRDYPVIMGIAIAAAVLVRAGALLQRVVYIMVNPRASHEESRSWGG
jgi:peptide/nickel transport system permease protein